MLPQTFKCMSRVAMRTIKEFADHHHRNSLLQLVILADKIACKCHKN